MASGLLTLAHASPYKGLASYTEDDADLFFGRERECEVIVSNLKARRLTLLYGESGVGKSSLLRAGVAARLLAEAEEDVEDVGRPDFIPVVFSAWRDDPASGLARAILAMVARFGGSDARAADGVRIDDAIAAAGALGTQPLVILDQFEEYFLYHPPRAESDAFGEAFPRALNAADLQASFLVSIREDALAKLDRFKRAVPRLFDASLRVDRLDHAAAREAIVRPLQRYNAGRSEDEQMAIAPELVDAVVHQVTTGHVVLEQAGHGALQRADEADGDRIETPYLQLVMSRLWDTERAQGSPELRLTTLDALGGAEEIVRTHLDAALSGLSPRERDAAVDIFHHLVTPSGSKIAHAASDLAEYSGRPEAEVTALIEKLARSDTRIIRPLPPPPGEDRPPRYEIYHDVLGSSILDWRVRQSTARRVAAEKRAARALLRRVVGRIAVGVALACLALIAVLAVLARNDASRDAAAVRLRAASEHRITAFSSAVSTRFFYIRPGRFLIFRSLSVSAPRGSAVTASCLGVKCDMFHKVVGARGRLAVTVVRHKVFSRGDRVQLTVTRGGVGKLIVHTISASGVDSTVQRCRPTGSSIPVSQLPNPCPRVRRAA